MGCFKMKTAVRPENLELEDIGQHEVSDGKFGQGSSKDDGNFSTFDLSKDSVITIPAEEIDPGQQPRKKIAQGPNVENLRDMKNKIVCRRTTYVLIAGYVSLACLAFSKVEGWSALDSFYFVAVTLTTVGYGDFSPSTEAGQLVACVFILVGLAIIAALLGLVADYFFEKAKAASAKTTDLEKSPYHSTIVASLFAFLSIFVGFIFYGALGPENITWIEALYFSVVTCTTVGYGDVLPTTKGGKVFALFWTMVGTLTVGNFLGSFMSNYVEVHQARKREKELKRAVKQQELAEIDDDGDGQVSIAEFVVYKIEKMGLVSAEDINRIADEFAKLDKDGDMKMDLGYNFQAVPKQDRSKSSTGVDRLPTLDDVVEPGP